MLQEKNLESGSSTAVVHGASKRCFADGDRVSVKRTMHGTGGLERPHMYVLAQQTRQLGESGYAELGPESPMYQAIHGKIRQPQNIEVGENTFQVSPA